MKNKVLMIFCLLIISCGGDGTASDCTDCGGGLVDGFLYKEVTSDDLSSLSQINVDALALGTCIRFKLDEEDFSEATVVDDCCCLEY